MGKKSNLKSAIVVLIVITLWVISGALLFFATEYRTMEGYFENHLAISFYNITYVMFFGLTTGIFIGTITTVAIKHFKRIFS